MAPLPNKILATPVVHDRLLTSTHLVVLIIYPLPWQQRRSQDFFWGGQFSVISGGRPDSVGGGGAWQIQWGGAWQIQWGGEVVAEIFRDRRKAWQIQWGGVVVFFCFFGNRRSRSIKLPQFREFFGHFRVASRLPGIYCRKKTFTKSLGGGMAPLATPLHGSATARG